MQFILMGTYMYKIKRIRSTVYNFVMFVSAILGVPNNVFSQWHFFHCYHLGMTDTQSTLWLVKPNNKLLSIMLLQCNRPINSAK